MNTEESDHLTKTTAVPNWMVSLAVWAIGILGTGAVLTLVSTVNWCFWMQSKQGEMESAIVLATSQAKAANDQVGGMRQTLNDIKQDVAVIKARMP